MVSFTPRPLYPQGKTPVAIRLEVGEPQNQSELCQKRKFLTLLRLELKLLGRPADTDCDVPARFDM
jgi:hypothetical protein